MITRHYHYTQADYGDHWFEAYIEYTLCTDVGDDITPPAPPEVTWLESGLYTVVTRSGTTLTSGWLESRGFDIKALILDHLIDTNYERLVERAYADRHDN